MALIKFLALATMVAVALSLPLDYGSGIKQDGMPYSFDWSVIDPDYGNNYGHQEASDGNAVKGVYYVLLPDGRTQTVKYHADHDSGFVADVQYEGVKQSHGYN